MCVCSLEIPSGYKVLTYLSFYVFFYFDVVWLLFVGRWQKMINFVSIVGAFLFPLFPPSGLFGREMK
jgi:hypothetical protein